jgi:hypothetical protein
MKSTYRPQKKTEGCFEEKKKSKESINKNRQLRGRSLPKCYPVPALQAQDLKVKPLYCQKKIPDKRK